MRAVLSLMILGLFVKACFNDQAKKNKSSILSQLIQDSEKRQFPFTNGEAGLVFKESESSKHLISRIQEVLDSDFSWKFQGPIGISGRMLCLDINPKDTQEVWAGSASGGLWKSTQSGIGPDAWKPVKTGFPVSSFSAIAINPDSSNIILAGTGEIYNSNKKNQGRFYRTLRGFVGIGILKSTDGGLNWHLSLDWSKYEDRGINRIAFDPSDSKIVYAATTHGLYQSFDAGENWDLILDKKLVCDVLIHTFDGRKLTVSVGGIGADDYGIFSSIDRGKSWIKVPYPDSTVRQGKIMIAHQKFNPDRIYAILSDQFKTIGFIRTIDGFKTFFQHSIPDISSYQGWYTRGLAVNEENSANILAGGVDLFSDEKGFGNQFKRLYASDTKVHVDFHDIVKNPIKPNSVYFCTDGGIFRSDDFGKTFYDCNGGLYTTQFYAGDFEDLENGRILGGLQDNQTAYRNGSGSWKKVASGDGGPCYFHPTDPNIQYYSAQNFNIFKSENAGNTWKEIIRPSANSSFISPFIMHPQNGDLLYGATDRVLFSSNQGDGWSESTALLDGNFIHVMNVHPTDPEHIIYAGISKSENRLKLYSSKNRGVYFDEIGETLPNRYVTDIEFMPSQDQTIAISLDGYLNDHVYLSKDGGVSWSNPGKGLPDLPVHCILIHPESPKVIYAGNDLGLFVTMDEGLNWFNATDSTMDAVPVYDLKLIKNENKIGIFTHGRGVFTTNLIQPSISNVDYPVVKENSMAFAFSRDQFLSLVADNTMGILVSIQGQSIPMSSQRIYKDWGNLTSGVYYFITDQIKIKCLIGQL